MGDDRRSVAGVLGQVLDTDDATLTLGDRVGQIVYVLPPLDWLPLPRPHVLARGPGDLFGRALANTPNSAQQPAAPLRVRLRVPAGRIYSATVLACLPPLGVLRARLRNALTPTPTLDAAAVPVALADLPDRFRATGSALSLAPASDEAQVEAEDHALAARRRLEGLQRLEAMFALEQRRGDAPVQPLLEGLDDEIMQVRTRVAYTIRFVAHHLPVAPFLEAARDTRELNFAWCLAAAYVFAAHADEVDAEILIELYHNVRHPFVKMAAVLAMGQLGRRAPVDLLVDLLCNDRLVVDIRIPRAAAEALGALGQYAPVTALIGGMERLQPEVASAAARALVKHPDDVPSETRRRARLLSDLETARRIIYQIPSGS